MKIYKASRDEFAKHPPCWVFFSLVRPQPLHIRLTNYLMVAMLETSLLIVCFGGLFA